MSLTPIFMNQMIKKVIGFSNKLFKEVNLKYDTKKTHQNMLSLASKYADLIYVVNNNSNDKKKIKEDETNTQDSVKDNVLINVKNEWPNFVKNINSERPSLSSALDHSTPTNIDGNQITITVSGLPE